MKYVLVGCVLLSALGSGYLFMLQSRVCFDPIIVVWDLLLLLISTLALWILCHKRRRLLLLAVLLPLGTHTAGCNVCSIVAERRVFSVCERAIAAPDSETRFVDELTAIQSQEDTKLQVIDIEMGVWWLVGVYSEQAQVGRITVWCSETDRLEIESVQVERLNSGERPVT